MSKLKIALFVYLTFTAIFGALIIYDYYQPRKNETEIVKSLTQENWLPIRKERTHYYVITDTRKLDIPISAYNWINVGDTISITTSGILKTPEYFKRVKGSEFETSSSYFYRFPLIPICCILPLFLHLIFIKNESAFYNLLLLDCIPIFAIFFIQF